MRTACAPLLIGDFYKLAADFPPAAGQRWKRPSEARFTDGSVTRAKGATENDVSACVCVECVYAGREGGAGVSVYSRKADWVRGVHGVYL